MVKAFTTEKKSERFVHVVAFKLSDSGKKKLDQTVDLLYIQGKRQSDTMRKFIDRVSDLTVRFPQLEKENQQLKAKIRKLEDQVKKEGFTPEVKKRSYSGRNSYRRQTVSKPLTQRQSTAYKQYQKDTKPQLPKSEGLTAIKGDKKEPSVIWCPTKGEDGDWIDKKECEVCRMRNFIQFSECYAMRNRIRIGKATEQDLAIMKPSKPRPKILEGS